MNKVSIGLIAGFAATGAGLFGLNLGLMAPVAALMLHMIFGAQMGWVFGALHQDALTHL